MWTVVHEQQAFRVAYPVGNDRFSDNMQFGTIDVHPNEYYVSVG